MVEEVIDRFSGEFRFLSNFFPCQVELDGLVYSSVEHAYQAAKTLDQDNRELIRAARCASLAKRLGRRVRLREDWDSARVDVMRELLVQKFKAGSCLADMLAATRPAELIEGNEWGDVFWGICNGKGENWLGRLLMGVRDAL